MPNPAPQQSSPLAKIPRDAAVVTAMPKEAFKAMFYMFAGKPDSRVKLFKRRVVVQHEDIRDLSRKIADKLKLHQIDQIVGTAIVRFDKEESLEFGTWAEFESFDWKTPYVTQSVSLKWDFMIKLPMYGTEQRHTLTVRLSATPRPNDVFQMIMSQDPDEEEVDDKIGLCVARVDFISHRLADELIRVVEEWNSMLRQPASACGWFCKLEAIDKWIARVIHYTMPILVTALACTWLGRVVTPSGNPASASDMATLVRWLLISILALYCSIRFSHYLASRCYSAINAYGAYIPFMLTRGDSNRADELQGRNRNQIFLFGLNCSIALLINITSAILTWWWLPAAK